ncbi:RNA deprotection pyrophosphohydrolase [Peribacillus sp. JNUCC 23]|uniref:RNA deprotection pyrophosphohydrolase n=1 Tax=Peribacillus sp. NPDC096379 TaxID=3364393 RepID=UPI00380AB72B
MKKFFDNHGHQVDFSCKEEFGDAWHVLVLTHWNKQWVVTRHKVRGLEFPGGKREKGETIEEAAVREVYEETGGKVASLLFLGQYRVHAVSGPFIKSIYFAELTELVEKDDYLETEGPVLLDQLPDHLETDSRFSFIMRDEVIPLSIERLRNILPDCKSDK